MMCVSFAPETIPVVAADLWLGARGLRDGVRGCGRRVGDRIEVDVAAVAAMVGAEAADGLVGYWLACRRFWTTFGAGHPGGPYVAIHRTLTCAVQRSTKSAKVDLTGELEALLGVGGVGELVEEATAAEPNWAEVDRLGAPLRAARVTNGTTNVISLRCEGHDSWPAVLGGAPLVGEVSRQLRITVAHAKWREGARRRLARVEVIAEELWPDPSLT